MSLAADSPVNSSSSEDFASYLDELEEALSEDSLGEDGSRSKDGDSQGDDGSRSKDGFEQDRLKRQKVQEWETGDSSVVSGGATTSQLGVQASTTNIPCSHPGFFRDMCMLCGQVIEVSGVALGYIHRHIRLDSEEIARIKHADLERKLKQDRKLYLVLDLDHTLLNSTTLTNVAPDEDHLKQGDLSVGLYRLDRMHMLTKLRPFVHSFLKEAYSMYEMHIYTMAEQSYALEMAKLLDPTGMYFGDRIISQSDCTKRHQKGLDVVVGAENAVLILDDTDGVWQQHRDNLILMERYHYFASSSGQFGLHGKSLSERMVDESETDGALSTILTILRRVHHEFFLNMDVGADIKDKDVRSVLKMIRKEILKDCKLIFSHLFPMNSSAGNQPLWRMAEQLGAICSTDLDSSATHVVAGDRGTDKAKWAARENKFLVSPSWIEAANYLWRRLPEKEFAVPDSKG